MMEDKSQSKYGNAGASRYFSENDKFKVGQGVAGSVVDCRSVTKFLPYLVTGIQQDIGVRSLDLLPDGVEQGIVRFEMRSESAQAEGNVNGFHTHEKKLYA